MIQEMYPIVLCFAAKYVYVTEMYVNSLRSYNGHISILLS